ncbi:hypothetical protein BKA66DRAFT_505015 [Pyrenochaeta sp. MPI-SDFR-AT-0127]|nr:hypothetical protein BKA66DRAFT_505015 [Pyrenochaeta sp. MPI-SDFR-AT-0127]
MVVKPAGFIDLIPQLGVARVFFLSAMRAVLGEAKQKWIACEDVGKVVVKALLKPDEFSMIALRFLEK